MYENELLSIQQKRNFAKSKKDILNKKLKKTRLKSTKEKDISNWFSRKKEASENKWALFLLNIRMSAKTLKFNNFRLNKKEFHKSKQPTDLMSVNTEQIVTSDWQI